MKKLQTLVQESNPKMKKADLVSDLYWELQSDHNVTIINDSYLEVDGTIYNFRRKNGQWTIEG